MPKSGGQAVTAGRLLPGVFIIVPSLDRGNQMLGKIRRQRDAGIHDGPLGKIQFHNDHPFSLSISQNAGGSKSVAIFVMIAGAIHPKY